MGGGGGREMARGRGNVADGMLHVAEVTINVNP